MTESSLQNSLGTGFRNVWNGFRNLNNSSEVDRGSCFLLELLVLIGWKSHVCGHDSQNVSRYRSPHESGLKVQIQSTQESFTYSYTSKSILLLMLV